MEEKTTFYYYKEGGGTLTDSYMEEFTVIYTFEAVDITDAERQLKEVCPDSPLFNTQEMRCPKCYGTQYQILPRKIMGVPTNKFDRVCVRCQKKFW